MSARPFQAGDRVRLAEHLVPHFDGHTHGIVDQHPVGKQYQDVLVNVGGRVYWFAATDLTLDPLEADDEPIYLELDGVVLKAIAGATGLTDLLDYGWEQITREEAMSWQPFEDDGTEAESLAEVSPPAFPDVLVHGRPPLPRYSQAGFASLVTQ